MAKKNPFEVLGITPEMAARLKDEELYRLAKSCYRALLSIYHPDHNKSSKLAHKKVVEINLAFEKIDLEKNENSFHRFRKLYENRLKRGWRKKATGFKNEIDRLQEKIDGISERFWEHLLLFGERELNIENGFGNTVLKPYNITLGLHDVALNYNLRYSTLDFGRNYKEIKFDEEGIMYYRELGRERFDRIGYIRLIGTVPKDGIDIHALLEKEGYSHPKRVARPVPSRHGDVSFNFDLKNYISFQNFKKYCLPLLTPHFREQHYLFSIHKNYNKPYKYIQLEGIIVKITPVSKGYNAIASTTVVQNG